jgi:hypothetical protein
MTIINLDNSTSLVDFCKEVLKKRFPNDPVRHQINDGSHDKLNFCCPFCGDSKSDKNKKRGNLYLKTMSYKCYNDGCEIILPLEKFFSALGSKYGLLAPDFTPKLDLKIGSIPKRRGFIFEFLLNNESRKKLLSFSKIVERFELKPCADAPTDSRIGAYSRSRLLNETPFFEKTCYYDQQQDKIYIFNLDLKSDRILGLSLRYITNRQNGLKYNIKNYSEFKKSGLVSNLDDDFIEKINQLNNYYNILNIDFSKTITLVEGQFDSLFIENCVATTGVSKSKKMLSDFTVKKNTRILFDNDHAGITHSLELMKEGYLVFLWSSATQQLKKDYPDCIQTIKKIKDVNDLFIFMKSEDPWLDLPKFNRFIDEYFSNSILDLIFL